MLSMRQSFACACAAGPASRTAHAHASASDEERHAGRHARRGARSRRAPALDGADSAGLLSRRLRRPRSSGRGLSRSASDAASAGAGSGGRRSHLVAAVGAELRAGRERGAALGQVTVAERLVPALGTELAAEGDVAAAVGAAHLGLRPAGHGLLQHARDHHAQTGAGAQAQPGRGGRAHGRCRRLRRPPPPPLARSPMACAALNWK